MKATLHQPDLLPWSGFWYKMATTEVFGLLVHDQYQKGGYQKRVQMRGTWVSHRTVKAPLNTPIRAIELHEGWQAHLANSIRGRYQSARYWGERGEDLIGRIEGLEPSALLAEANVQLIHMIRELLGIQTPLVIVPEPPEGLSGRDRVLWELGELGCTRYVSGTGGTAYLGEEDDIHRVFGEAGMSFEWSRHAPRTGDSIVTLLMDEADPLAAILEET